MAETRLPRHVTDQVTHPENTFAIQDDADDDAFAASTARMAARHIQRREFDQAENCAKMGLDRVPDHAGCMSYLAVCVAVGSQKFVVAERIAQQTVRTHPTDGHAHYALGRVNLLKDRRKIAFRNFDQSRDLARGDRMLQRELDSMEPRRPPVLAGLPRNHWLNVCLGWLRARFRPKRKKS